MIIMVMFRNWRGATKYQINFLKNYYKIIINKYEDIKISKSQFLSNPSTLFLCMNILCVVDITTLFLYNNTWCH